MKQLKTKQVVWAILSGVLVGVLNGFLGAGGGMLVVPILRLVFKQEPKVAHSTAVLTILPVSLISGIIYMLKKQIELSILLPVAVGTFLGGLIGTFLLSKLKNNAITMLFSLVMIIAGALMILKGFSVI